MSGTLYIKNPSGSKKQEFLERTYFLKNKIFYAYIGEESYPSQMVFLNGCFLKPIQDEGGRSGFQLSTDHIHPLKLYAPSKFEAAEWIAALKKAAGMN